MRRFVSAMLLVVGIIHLLPLSGILGAERLAQLYGASFVEPTVELLMRHRAVLFGLLGMYLIVAAFRTALQPLAFAAGFVSVVSFLGLAWPMNGVNAEVRRVILVDAVALVCLVLGSASRAYATRRARSD
jgi:hypothetical protein